jgi:hypothetical protein
LDESYGTCWGRLLGNGLLRILVDSKYRVHYFLSTVLPLKPL